MNLTRGQKEALARKAESLIQKKREDKEKELHTNWKDDANLSAYLEKLVPVQEAFVAFHKALKDAGMSISYASFGVEHKEFGFLTERYDVPDPENFLSSWRSEIRNRQIKNQIESEYPDYISIMDDLELQCLDKSFNLDAFLDKYRNL